MIPNKENAIRELSETNPRAALASENCPEDVWWEKAEAYPIHAMESVLFDLNTLAEPERWHALEKRKAENWYDALVQDELPQRLSDQAKRLLAVECAAKVLPYFEEKYPKEKRPALAIKEAILYAFDRSTKENLAQARAAAWAAAEAAAGAAYSAARAAYSAADSAADSAEARAAWAAEGAAAWAAARAVEAAGAGSTRQEFYRWAWQRALTFLYDPNQFPPPWNQFPDLPPPYDRIMATEKGVFQ